MADDVTERVLAQYPSLRFLLGDPEVGPLLVQAVDPNAGFSQQTFEARLHETNWWKTTPAVTRQALIQANTDPATSALQNQRTHSDLLDWLLDMGVAMEGGTRDFITGAMNAKGENINDSVVQLGLRNYLKSNPNAMTPGGRLDSLTKQVYGMARSDYFLPVEWWWAQGKAIGLATGEIDEATLRQELLSHAGNAFPQLGDWIMQGQTPAEIIDPLRKVAADELEVDVNQIDIGNPQWKFLTGVPNDNPNGTSGKQGGWRLPTYSEVQEAARRDARWWQTSKGRQADAGMARTLLSAFGKVAS